MPIKSIVAEEQEKRLEEDLKKGKRMLYEAIEKDLLGVGFVVLQKDGHSMRAVFGMAGPIMIGLLEMLKIDLALQGKMQEEAEHAH